MAPDKYYLPKASEGDVLYHVENKKYYLVEAVEALGNYVKNFGAISAGAKLEKQEVNVLYPELGYIAEFRILPIDDVNVYIRVPRESLRGALKNATFYISKFMSDNIWYHTLTELWVVPEQKVWFDVEDASGSGLTTSKVRFVGWLYKVREIPEAEASGRRIVKFRTTTITIGAAE